MTTSTPPVASPSRRWLIALLLGTILVTVGVIGLLVGFGFGQFLAIVLGVVFLVGGAISLAYTPAMRREGKRFAEGDAAPQPAQASGLSAVAPGEEPWPIQVVAQELAERLRGTGYQVACTEHRIQLDIDIADATWPYLFTEHRLRNVRTTRLLLERPGRVLRQDTQLELEWQAGVLGVSGDLRFSGGRSWTYQRRVDLATGKDGVERAVDYTYSTRQINEAIDAVLAESGWRPRGNGLRAALSEMDAEARLGAAMGGYGILIAIFVGGGFALADVLGLVG